jgi:electron transport complex protein RnfG
MGKKESSLKQLVLSLTLITCIAAIALTVIYTITKGPIAISQQKKKTDAISKVLPEFKGETKETKVLVSGDKDSVTIYLAYQNDSLFGAAVETYTNKAFDGTFSIMVGFDAIGNIIETEVLQANETPGLGDKIDKKKSDFPIQFKGKNPKDFKLQVKKDGGEVDAITAATISSRAFCDAIQRASNAFLKIKENGNEQN